MAVKYGIREQGYDILDPAYNSKSIWIEATGDEGGGGGGGGGGEGGTGLPDGGTAGQILIKKSSVDGDAAWEDAPFVDTTALAPYITSATAAATYATKTELADYLTKETATATYATKTELDAYIDATELATSLAPYLTSATAAATYATKTELADYLTKATAAATYATKTELDAYIDSTELATALAPYITSATAASTYATKTELADYATTAYVDNKISGVSVLVSDLEDDLTALTNTVNTKITDPSTKTNGDVLTFDGNNWIAAAPSGGGGSGDYLAKNNPTGTGRLNITPDELPTNTSDNLMVYTGAFRPPSNYTFSGHTIYCNVLSQKTLYENTSGSVIFGQGINTTFGQYSQPIIFGRSIELSHANNIAIGRQIRVDASANIIMADIATLRSTTSSIIIGRSIATTAAQSITNATIINPKGASPTLTNNSRLYIGYGEHNIHGVTDGTIYKDSIAEGNQFLTKSEIVALINSMIGA